MSLVPFHLIEPAVTGRRPDDEQSRVGRERRRAGTNGLRVSLLAVLAFLAYQRPARALDPNRLISQYAHNAWTTQDGSLPGGIVSIAQTTDGYLWIGTEAGLLRFDGVRFNATSPPVQRQPAYSSARIQWLLGARDGSLWIEADLSRGQPTLSRWTGKELLSYPVTDTAIAQLYGMEGIYQIRSGDLWLVEPLCRIMGSEPRCYGKAEGLPDTGHLRSLAEDAHGYLWIGGNTGVFRWSPGARAVTVYSPARLMAEAQVGVYLHQVHSIVVAPDDSVWVGINERGLGVGLEHLAQGKWTSAIAPGVDGSKWPVEALLLDRDGGLWIGTVDEGLYHLYGQRVDHYGRTDGLSSDFVIALYEDREGNVWALTPRGIDRFRDTAVTTFSRIDGLCSQEADSLLVTHDGTLWVGGNRGALSALQGDRIVCLSAARRPPGDQVTSLFEDHARQLWVGVDDKIGIYEHDRFTPVNKADGTPLGMIVSIAEDVDHNVWMVSGGAHRRLFRVRDRAVTEEPALPGMPEPHEVAADPVGGLWLGLMNGDLARYRNGGAELVHFDRPADSAVTQLAVRRDGSVLAASGSGLLVWKNGKGRVLTARNGLPCDWVSAFIADDSGPLWLYLRCGYVEITAAQLQNWWTDPNTVLKLRVLDVLDGMQPGGAWFQSVSARTPDGRLWFGGNVLQMIDPTRNRDWRVAPLVHVENIIADLKHYEPGRALELPALTHNLEIDYTAPVFAIPQRVRFRYKLEGSDRDWQDAGARREALYTDLGPGRYTFRVIASTDGGAWGANGASVAFRVAPAFYQTQWFYALCGITCVALLTALYRVRVRRVSAQVRGRMEARLAERERIARDLHDTLLQGMQGLIWRFQAATDRIPADQPARQLMEQSLNRADTLLEEARSKIKELRPAASEVADLAKALAAEGEQLAQDPFTTFRASVQGTPRELHPIVREEGFMVGREALVNAFRHSGAKEVEVEITYDDTALHVRVRDDGRGISAHALDRGGKPQHFGLIGMRERAKKLGGHLEIWSKPDAGTEIDLRIPAYVAYRQSKVSPSRARSLLDIFRSSGQPH